MSGEMLCRCGKPLSMHHDSREPNLPAGAILSHPGTPTPVPSEVAETTAGEREVEALAKVLAAHRFQPTRSVDGTLGHGWCGCGKSYGTKPIDEHEAHVATALAALLDRVRGEEGAKAWEAGHRHRQRRGPDECQCGAYYDGECGCGKYGSGPLVSLDDNPYRAAPVARDLA